MKKEIKHSHDNITMGELLKKNNYSQFLVLVLILLGIQLSVTGQNAKKMLEEYKLKYPNSPFIILDKSQIVSIDIVKGDIKITEKSNQENFYLETVASGGILSEDKISFSSFSKIDDIQAMSYIPDGNKFREKKVKDFKVESEFSRGVFHDDVESINFIYPALQKGARSKLSYTKTISEPRFLPRFYLISPVPTLNQKYVLEVHQDVKIDVKEFNTENIGFDFKKSKKGNKEIYTWILKDAPKFEFEDNAPNISYYAPHIIPHITHYKIDGKEENLLSNADDLFAWYNTLIGDVNKDIDEGAVKKLVEEITKDAKTDLEKVKLVYYWTQDNIKYIAFEEGMDGLIPRNTDQVLNQKYGDCKDMGTCISTLLKYADVPASVVWIGTDDIPYTHTELPLPAVDNHMIAAYKDKDKYYFLDATSEYTPFGMPSRFIQGQEAMIKTGPDTYELAEVPVVEAARNSKTETAKLEIIGDKLVGNATTLIDGYYKSELMYRLSNVDKKEQFIFFSNYLNRGSNKFILEEVEVENEFDKEQVTKVDYTFNIDDYIFVNDAEIYVNLSFYDWCKRAKIKEDRNLPIVNKYKNQRNVISELKIPKDYKVDFVPTDLVLENALFTYASKYEVSENEIIHTESYIENFIQLKKENFKQFNDFIDEISETINQTVTLIKRKQ